MSKLGWVEDMHFLEQDPQICSLLLLSCHIL